MSAAYRRRPHFSFWSKVVLAVGLVALVDQLFHGPRSGATVGAAALAWTLCALCVHRSIWFDRRAQAAMLVAAALALAMIDQPSPVAWAMFWTALSLAALLPRTGRFDDVWRWGQRLVFHGVVTLVGPLLDAWRVWAVWQARNRSLRLLALAGALALPVVGGGIFLALFATANPVIAQALDRMRLPCLDIGRLIFWGFTGMTVWAVFRPRRLRRTFALFDPQASGLLPEVGVLSVGLSLVVFNLLFALQNGLDIAFLWSGARLPDGLTLAEYAHRGAYALILTALLAGLFVLAALRPDSATARTPAIRWLVTGWVAQNLFLVASSMLRTFDYIDAYSLTRFRIAALIWMGLVAVGLVLITWRMLRDRSAAWLLNANALAAVLVLGAISVTDLGEVAATWNVRHAREVGGRGVDLDLCYLRSLGASALIPLAKLEQRPLPPAFADRVRAVRREGLTDLIAAQADWHEWTALGARRLARLQTILPAAERGSGFEVRGCYGEDADPPPMIPAAPNPDQTPDSASPATPPASPPLTSAAPH